MFHISLQSLQWRLGISKVDKGMHQQEWRGITRWQQTMRSSGRKQQRVLALRIGIIITMENTDTCTVRALLRPLRPSRQGNAKGNLITRQATIQRVGEPGNLDYDHDN
jgi:hypothetical protein